MSGVFKKKTHLRWIPGTLQSLCFQSLFFLQSSGYSKDQTRTNKTVKEFLAPHFGDVSGTWPSRRNIKHVQRLLHCHCSVCLFVKTRLKAPAHPQDRKIDTTQNNTLLNYTNSNNPPKISENPVLSCFLFRKMSGFQNPLALQTSGWINCYLVSRSFGSKA